MLPSPNVEVVVDLRRVAAAAREIKRRCGVAVIAVIKADAYGLGAERVAAVLDPLVDELAVFSLDELARLGRPGLVLGPAREPPERYRELGARPVISTLEQARRYRGLPAVVNVDTGMQRFGCDPRELADLLDASGAREIMTHAQHLSAAQRLAALCPERPLRRHAAASSLLGEPQAWLDAVRPGLALYERAMRVSTRLANVRETRGPVGYGGFAAPRVGVILAGYANGLRPGAPILINGRRESILEVGMNTAFVSVSPADRVGDEALLLGDELPAGEVAGALGIRPHEVLCIYGQLGVRRYVD